MATRTYAELQKQTYTVKMYLCMNQHSTSLFKKCALSRLLESETDFICLSYIESFLLLLIVKLNQKFLTNSETQFDLFAFPYPERFLLNNGRAANIYERGGH